MSLQVWLPLNGNLNNQGLSDITFTGTPTWRTSGKIGASALDLSSRINFNCSELIGIKYFSVCFWGMIEPNPDSTANWMDVFSLTDKSTSGTIGYFRFETGYGATAQGGIHWHDNATNAIINGAYTYNTATEQNKWHHICVTISEDKVCSYYDGILKQTHISNLGGGSLTGVGWIGESTTRGGIQDLRIYDHALSTKEVEEISKGLILHYKLDNNGLGGKNFALDTSIIYDSSGYQNNGEIINNISIISDTPRYDSCIHMSATNQKIKISNFPTTGFGNSYSFVWWEKISSASPMHWGFADGIRLNGMYTGRLWNTGDSSDNPLYTPGTTTQVATPSTGVWHHWAMIGDGITCKVYQDGVLWGQAKTYKAISGSTIYINGWDNGTSYCSDNASMSDFRIYCTALTAEQVKELYDTSATVDKNGNIYAREVQEI